MASMMLVVPDTADVVPRVRLVTDPALLELRMGLAAHGLRHHFEVHHRVTWRRQMALEAESGS